MGPIAETTPFGGANVMDLLGLIKGSSSSQSTKGNMSSEGMNALIQQMLSGSAGIGAIASGTKNAGGYNSSAQTLMTNDLMTRAAGQLGIAQAGTTVTNTKPSRLGSGDLGNVLLAGGLSSLLGPSVKGLGKKIGVSGWGDDLAKALGLSGDVGAGAGLVSDFGAEAATQMGSQVGSSMLGSLTGLGDLTDFSGNALDIFGNGGGDVIDAIGEGASVAGDIGAEVAGDTLFPGAGTALNLLMPGLLNQGVSDVASIFGDIFSGDFF